MINVEELKKQRARLFAKRSQYNKKGMDVSDISAELESIKKQLAEAKSTKTSSTKSTKSAKSTKTTSKASDAKKMEPIDVVKSAIAKYGWKNGMTFKKFGCSLMKIERLRIKDAPAKSEVVVSFTLRYKSDRHEVKNDVVWHVPYSKVELFKNDLHNVQYGVKTQKVFSDKKFSQSKFNTTKLSDKGWNIIK